VRRSAEDSNPLRSYPSSSNGIKLVPSVDDVEVVEKSDQDRCVRVVIDVARRRPTEDERERWTDSVARTPNAVGGPFEAVWAWRVALEQPAGDTVLGLGRMHGAEDERLAEIIAQIKQAVSVGLARRLSDRQMPIDRRFAELIGTGQAPTRSEVAARLSELLGLSKPTLAASEHLLADLALLAHRWYDDPYAPTESTDVGHGIVSAVAADMADEDFQAAIDDLGVEDDVRLWGVAADLVARMGVPVW
jgi:hypothetical protein